MPRAESIFPIPFGERHSKGSILNLTVGMDVLQALTVKSGCMVASIRVVSRVVLVPVLEGGDFFMPSF